MIFSHGIQKKSERFNSSLQRDLLGGRRAHPVIWRVRHSPLEVGDCRITVRLDEEVREACKISSSRIGIAGLQKEVTDPAEVRRVRNRCQRNQRLLSIRSAARDLLPRTDGLCRSCRQGVDGSGAAFRRGRAARDPSDRRWQGCPQHLRTVSVPLLF